jgi:hypothetical protein
MREMAKEYAAKTDEALTLEHELSSLKATATADVERLQEETMMLRAELEHSGKRMAEMQAEREANLELIHGLEGQMREVEGREVVDERLNEMAVELQQARHDATAFRAIAENADTLCLEKDRLAADNEVLSLRLGQLEAALSAEKAALGHGNQRQKIQYHLRLKQELEEMRHECTVLLRERFHLEQCIRYVCAN